ELPGAVLKVSLIGDSLVANGSFFNIDQSGFPVWLSNTRVTDENLAERPALGLIFSRCEPAPILRAYLKQSAFASEGFSEMFGGYLIRYAFMPIETTGLPFIWRGSGHIHLPQILAAADSQKSETKIIKSRQGDEEILTNRLNQGMPHNAIVLATPMRATTAFSNAFLAAAGSIIYLLTVFYLVNRLLDLFFVRPVMAMAGCAEQIARGSTTWSLQLNTGDELSSLNLSFSRLVTGLQQRNMLKDYLSDDAFSEIADTGTEKLAPGGEYREATIIFAAISDYQKLTAGCSAAESIKILNQYIGIGDQIVRKHGGSIDKILNQTLMLVFRESPAEIGTHALKAAQTVLELAEATKKQLGTGVYAGISSGTVISGKIGSYQGKLDFTVIGNPVNLAARLKSEAADSNTGIIISGAT
ncbi:MAG TPA: adenylate/guanylate cyclase domain-containing protein, partial [Candidatus Rifleibacterium sp.]|nr:adenylate/guanylate cyclase domain-containing protein [Candidatus Rifleibacterium sp.]